MSNDSFTVDPEKISLTGLYTDISDPDAKETTVYANGNMQARIYIGYSYNDYDVDDSDPDVINALNDYVVNYIEFYKLDDLNRLTALTGWEESTESNGYQHDLDHLESDSNLSPYAISGQRVPYYLMPPAGVYGAQTRLCAQLVGTNEQTSTNSPAIVHTQKLVLEDSDLKIRDLQTIDVSEGQTVVLRSLCYNPNGPSQMPDSHKPEMLETYRGVKGIGKIKIGHTSNMVDINSWISFYEFGPNIVGAFVEPNSSEIAILKLSTPIEYETVGISLDYQLIDGASGTFLRTVDLDASDVTDGIPMCKLTGSYIFDQNYDYVDSFDVQNFITTDNYGNRVSFNIDWNDDDSDYEDWALIDVNVLLP